MKTDLKHCPPEADIEIAFEKLHKHRQAITVIETPYQSKIDALNAQMEVLIQPLIQERTQITSECIKETESDDEAIAILTDEIKQMVLENGKTCSTVFGTCTYVKSRKGAVKWDDAALMGYVSASPENETILQFRSEEQDGKPHTRFKLVDTK